jgi:hypothetical protein
MTSGFGSVRQLPAGSSSRHSAAELGKEDEPSLDPEAFCHDKDRVMDLVGTDWACIINQLETNSELQGIGEAMNECN